MIHRAVLAAVGLLLAVSGVPVEGASDVVASTRLTTPRSGHTATLLDGGGVMLAGGWDGTATMAQVEVIDAAAGTAEPCGALLHARSDHTATPLANGGVLLAGGHADGSTLDSAEVWDPSTCTSQATGAMGSARAGHVATLLDDGRVLLIGGEGPAGKPVRRAEIYDPASGTFEGAGRTQGGHIGVATTLLPDGRVLVTGTTLTKGAGPAELFIPRKTKWKALGGTGRRAGHTSTLLRDGRVLLAGGLVGMAGYGATQLFDPADGSFLDLPPLTAPRSRHTATLLPDGRVVILGGSDFGFEVSPIEIFDPASGGFAVAGELESPRDGHTTTLLPDGRLLIAGGDFASLVLDDLLIYDAGTGSVTPLGGFALVPETLLDPGGPRTRAEVRASHGAPEAFIILYAAEPGIDGPTTTTGLERWSYYTDGVEYVLAGDEVVAADPVTLGPGAQVEPIPYDPDMFAPGMDLDEVLAAAGIDEYSGGPVEQLIEGGRAFFADRLAWGITGDQLRYVEAFALTAEADGAEDAE